MKVNKLLEDVDKYSQRADFQEFLETHLQYIKNNLMMTSKEIGTGTGDVFKGDFYGLLESFSVPRRNHYIFMRVNGLMSPCDYDGEVFTLLFPNIQEVERLLNQYKTDPSKKSM